MENDDQPAVADPLRPDRSDIRHHQTSAERTGRTVPVSARTPKKETTLAATEKPLALRKTPRAAAGSNMYRGKKPRRTGTSKTPLDASPSTETKSPVDLCEITNGPQLVVERSIDSVASSVLDANTTTTTTTTKEAAASTIKGRKRKARTAIDADATDVELDSSVKRSRKLPKEISAANSASSPSQTHPTKVEVDDGDGDGDGGDADADGGDDDGDVDGKDEYCWLCHRQCSDAVLALSCDVCPRSYHTRCLGGQAGGFIREAGSWVCPECRAVLRAENTDTRSPAMQMLDLEQLCSLLKFALARMKVLCPVEFLQPVDLTEFQTYQSYVVHPMDLGMLETNLKQRMYGSTESFMADAKWLQHNCVVFNGQQHKLSQMAKALLKVCRQEMAEIEVCPDCYRNAHTKRGNWFVETCNLPHLLIWAKLKGFPFWPGKAMRIVSGSVDVRFFGAHDRAWISLNQCYLLSRTPPTPHKNKKRMFEQSMDELETHVRRLRERFGTFEYASLRAPLVEQNVLDGVRAMLPQFDDPTRIERFLVSPTKLKCEEGVASVVVTATGEVASNPIEDNASDSASRSSQLHTPARPREESVRNLESTIERIFQKKKAKKSCSDKESGDDSTASYSNFSAAIAAAAADANSNSNSGDSVQSKPEPVVSNADGNVSSNAASDSVSGDRAENEEPPDERASNGTASDENSKTGDDGDCSVVNGDGSESGCKEDDDDDDDGDDGDGDDDDDEEEEDDDDDDDEEEGGLVIDTSTDDDNNTGDDTEESKVDAVEYRVSPVSSQTSGRQVVPDDSDDHVDNDDNYDHDAEEEEEEEEQGEGEGGGGGGGEEEAREGDDDDEGGGDVEMSLPILERHSRPNSSLQSVGLDDHPKKKEDEVKGETAGDDAVRRLRLELDRIGWQHRQEIAEAKHNADLVLLEMRRSLEAEKEREIAALRRHCDAERFRAVRDAKRKQWCTVCLEESSLMCCWNTSYCDYPCQRKHWPLHVSTCSRYKLSKSSKSTPELNSEAEHANHEH